MYLEVKKIYKLKKQFKTVILKLDQMYQENLLHYFGYILVPHKKINQVMKIE